MQIFRGDSKFAPLFVGGSETPTPKAQPQRLVDVDPPRRSGLGDAGLSIAHGLGCLPRWKNPHKKAVPPPPAHASQGPVTAASVLAGRVNRGEGPVQAERCRQSPDVQETTAPTVTPWQPPEHDASYWQWRGACPWLTPSLSERSVVVAPATLIPRDEALSLFQPYEAVGGPGDEGGPLAVLSLRDSTPMVTVPPSPQRPAPQPVKDGGQESDDAVTHQGSDAPVAIGPRRDSRGVMDTPFDPQAMDLRARSLVEAIKAIIRRDDSVKHAGREMHVKHGDIGKLLMSALHGKGGYAIDDAVVRDVLLLVARDSEIDDGMRMHLFQQVTRPRIGLTNCLGLQSLQAVAAQLRASQRSWKDVWAFGQTVSNLYNVHARLLRENAAALKYEIAAVEACGRDAGKDKRADSVRFALSVGARRSLNEIRSPAPARKS